MPKDYNQARVSALHVWEALIVLYMYIPLTAQAHELELATHSALIHMPADTIVASTHRQHQTGMLYLLCVSFLQQTFNTTYIYPYFSHIKDGF